MLCLVQYSVQFSKSYYRQSKYKPLIIGCCQHFSFNHCHGVVSLTVQIYPIYQHEAFESLMIDAHTAQSSQMQKNISLSLLRNLVGHNSKHVEGTQTYRVNIQSFVLPLGCVCEFRFWRGRDKHTLRVKDQFLFCPFFYKL